MLERYATDAMRRIWSEPGRLKLWRDIQALVCRAYGRVHCQAYGETPSPQRDNFFPPPVVERITQGLHFIPEEAGVLDERAVQNFADWYDFQAFRSLENNLQHESLAFLTQLGRQLDAWTLPRFGESYERFLHFGMTSSDMLDTGFALQLQAAGKRIASSLETLAQTLKHKIETTQTVLTIGRTHGQPAEPMALALKFASFYAECRRNQQRLDGALEEVRTCSLSGPVGNYSTVPPEVEAYLAQSLNLKPEPIATQIIPRDRHAHLMCCLGLIAAFVERVALQIRLLQQAEIGELQEPFGTQQRGSSAMPHKRNPIMAENLCGLMRRVRTNVPAALENISQWHERDMAHSSTERHIWPETCALCEFALIRLERILAGLTLCHEALQKNRHQTLGFLSHQLLGLLIRKGMRREQAYQKIQKIFEQPLQTEKQLRAELEAGLGDSLTETDIQQLLDPEPFLRHTPFILERLLS